MKPDSRGLLVDVVAVAVMSVALCVLGQQPQVMLGVTLGVMAVRTVVWSRWAHPSASLAREAALLAICAVVGGFNDWNTVVRHGVYGYNVPSDLLPYSSIPLWMLLYWGLVLRGLASLGGWHGLGAEPASRPRVGTAGMVAAMAFIMVVTRQSIFRLYLDPVGSWLPFALAIGLYVVVWRPAARRLRLAAIMLVVGPLTEVLYINAGHLHAYALGVVGGVPVWIVLWWVLAVLLWADVFPWLEAVLAPKHSGVPAPAPKPSVA